MATQTNEIRSQVPKVSYVKALDVWIFACQIFVILSFLEYTVVNVTARRSDDQLEQDYNLSVYKKGNKKNQLSKAECLGKAKQVDCIARILFPFTFLIFNLIYWVYYLVLCKEKHL